MFVANIDDREIRAGIPACTSARGPEYPAGVSEIRDHWQ